MAKVDAQGWLDKWGRRLNAAGTDIQNGVNNVTVAPGIKAAQQKALWLQRIQERADVWAKQVAAVPLESWKSAMLNKGVQRIAAGVTAAQKNKTQQIAALLSAVDTARAAAIAQPRGTLEQNIQRSITFMQTMSANAPKRKA